MMKRNIYLVIVTLFLSLSAGAKEKDVAIMQSMVKRLIPAYAENFQFKKIKPVDGKDCFQLDTSDSGKIVIGAELLFKVLLSYHNLMVCRYSC